MPHQRYHIRDAALLNVPQIRLCRWPSPGIVAAKDSIRERAQLRRIPRRRIRRETAVPHGSALNLQPRCDSLDPLAPDQDVSFNRWTTVAVQDAAVAQEIVRQASSQSL